MTDGFEQELLEHQAASGDKVLSEDKLGSVAKMANDLVALDKQIEEGEALLKELKEHRRIIAEKHLPEMMDALSLSKFSLTDGSQVEVKDFVSASITAANKTPAHEWLRNNGHGDIIKSSIGLDLGRVDDQEFVRASSDKLRSLLKDMGAMRGISFDPAVKVAEAVHPQTLQKLVREVLSAGGNLPEDLLGVYVGRVAKVTKPSA